jgi:hypothetical protein
MQETKSKGFLNTAASRVAPSVLIFNLKNKLVYMDQKARAIFPAFNQSGRSKQSKEHIIPREVYHLCNRLKAGFQKTGKGRVNSSVSLMTVRHHPPTTYALRGVFLHVGRQTGSRKSRFLMVLMQKLSHLAVPKDN